MLSRSFETATDHENISEEVLDAIVQAVGVLPQIQLSYEAEIKTLWVTIAPEPKPVMTYQFVQSIHRLQAALISLTSRSAALASKLKFFAYRANGPIYTLGGDLDFYLECIAKGDRQALHDYARLSIEGILGNASGLSGTMITMAAIAGKGIGGGIDAAISCNVAIAEEQVAFSYPEVQFNHFPITAVAVLTSRMAPRAALNLLTTGAELTAAKFEALGGLDAVVPETTGEAWLRKYATESLRVHRARLGLFEAFHRQRAVAFETELRAAAASWTDCMMGMTPLEISRLQRISAGQDRMLQHFYASIRARDVGAAASEQPAMRS